jgi:hypothetical protein
VVANGEPGDARELRGVADHELAGEAGVERGVGGDQRVEEEVAGGVEPVPAVLGDGEDRHESQHEGSDAPEGRGVGAAPLPEGQEKGPRDEELGQGEEPRPVGAEAQPVSPGAPRGSERKDERRVEVDAGEALEGEPGDQDRDPGEEEPRGEREG